MSDIRTIFVCPESGCGRWRGHSGPGPVLSREVASLYCADEGHGRVIPVEVAPVRSTPPLDEWLISDEVLEIAADELPALIHAEERTRIARHLLEALAEHRKEGQHG